jgi:D-glycero-alpha-D-manno-heptose-7-phosphate kinase
MIIARTPFRISFFGGGTDFPEWFNYNRGQVLSTTIDKYCYLTLRDLPPFFEHKFRISYSKIESVKSITEIEHPVVRELLNFFKVKSGIELHHDGDIPARSGVGSSSSFTVALIHALSAYNSKMISQDELSKLAIHIERDVLKEHVGFQDQIAAACGGLNKISFLPKNEYKISPVLVDKDRVKNLNDNLLLFFTGISRYSSNIIKHQLAELKNRESELNKMAEMVDVGVDILTNKNRSLDDFGLLLDESWQYKKSLTKHVTNDQINQIYKIATNNSAIGGKILGAGGGGFILFYAKRDNHEKIIKALDNFVHVPFRFEHEGSKIVLYQPSGFE